MDTEDGWLQRSLVATEDYGGCRGVLWLQRSLVAAEKSVGCRVSQESWGHIRTVSSTVQYIKHVGYRIRWDLYREGQYCGE